MAGGKAIARALSRNPYGAEARVLADGTMVGPKVTGWHGSRDPWLLAGKKPALTSQTGLHVGTKEQASRFSDGPTWPGRGYRGKVTLAEGREIETPDLVSWDGDKWEKALASGQVKGLAKWESDGLVDYIKAVREADGPVVAETVRKVLADDLGVKRVKYNNTHEGVAGSADNWSYIATAPDVITTHSLGKQLKDAAPYIGAGGALAAGAAALAPGEAQAATPDSALARAIARQAPRFNEALDTSLDIASFVDPSLGYATETVRALKDLPGQVGAAGTVALAPVVGATEMLGSIGQLPELGVAGGRAIARAIARAPQPRGSGTYRKKK